MRTPSLFQPLEPRRLFSLGTLTEQIIVDQFGYRADAKKYVLFANPITGQNSANAYTPGSSFQVRRAADDGLVLTVNSIAAWNGGATDSRSGDKVWTGDFSALTTPGDYYVYDPANAKRSYVFTIDNNLYDNVLRASSRVFYYQRTGTAITAQYGGNWTHAASHLQDKTALLWQGSGPVAGTARDVSGGWFDAGDYNKYVAYTTNVLWDLLSAVEWNGGAFSDATNIPESGNGVPDMVDEVKWETDWLLKMQLDNGSVLTRVGSTSFDVGNFDPSTDTQARYYTQASTWATASFAGSLAHAARVFARYDWQYPGYADALRAAAEKAWAYLQANTSMLPASGNDNASAVHNDPGQTTAQDDFRLRVLAAAELYKTTGNAAYRTYFDNNYNASNAQQNGFKPIGGYLDASLATDLNRAFVTYATTPGASAGPVAAIKAALKNTLDWFVVSQYQSGADPYRSYMFDGHYTWGSNRLKAEWANMATYAVRLGVAPSSAAASILPEIAQEYLHYLHGRNPLSQLYLTNMGAKGANLGGDKSQMQPYHSWFGDGSPLYDGASSTYGPPPGYLVGGPNQYYTGGLTPPTGQPMMKAYVDFNTGYPQNSWEITEPAIYYQASYTLLLSTFATDAYAPTVRARDTAAASPTVTLQFSEDVGSTLAAGDLTVTNLTTPGAAPTIASVVYDPATGRATVTFAPPAGQSTLPKGNYRLTLKAGSVSDGAGNALAAANTVDFFVLPGDATRDRQVNLDDLVALANHYGLTGGQTYATGDFTGDGRVDLDDLVLLANNYGTGLPAAAAAVPADLPAATGPLTAAPTATSTSSTSTQKKDPVPTLPAPARRPAHRPAFAPQKR